MMFDGLKVGDRVSVDQGWRNEAAEWTVTKIGRKYFKAGGCEFLLEDGSSKSGYSYPRASTLEERALNLRAAEARKRLDAFGIRLDHWTKRDKVLLVFEALQPQLPTLSPGGTREGKIEP